VSRQLLAATEGPRTQAETTAPRFRKVPHKVRRGETLASLANRFDVSQAQLRRWNDLPKGRALKPGRELVVFVPLPATAPSKSTAPAVAAAAPETIAAAPRTVRPVVSPELAAARQAQAEANAKEVARLQEVARQEKAQEARLVAIRQRQAIQQAAADAKARAEARRLAQAQAAEAKRSEGKEVAVATPEAPVESTSAAPNETLATYTVRKGDYLNKLAREHNVTVAQLVEWNGLDSEAVVPGQRLVLRAPAESEPAPAEAPTKQLKAVAKAAAPAAAPRAAVRKQFEAHQVHQVQRGDTLFNISRRFGVSVKVLREVNNLTSDEVKLGQKLLVPQS
jgi:membrane-bound lytic murein transglycosylase D